MKYSVLALPALLRPALILAASFSVNDDLLAFPQYEVRFSDDWVSESLANSRLQSDEGVPSFGQKDETIPSEVESFKPERRRVHEELEDDEDRNYESMTLDGQRYLCSIPTVKKVEEQPQQEGSGPLSKADEEKELALATDRGWELLSGMQGHCVYYISGWWSYKFCYNDGVRQFHQLPPSRGVPAFPPAEDPGVEGFTLGKYKDAASAQASKAKMNHETSASNAGEHAEEMAKQPGYGELVQRGDNRYLVQRLEGGTRCDLTGRERKIEVQFHCSPQSVDRISLIKEVSTCAYLMVIQTPRLCSDVAFLPPQKDQPNTLLCSPVLAEHEIESYEKDLKALRAAEDEARIWEEDIDAARVFLGQDTTDAHRVVGDVVVGGHNIVPEGVKIEKSSILTGGKKYIDTVASSSGKVLSKEELKKLGLEDTEAVEELKKRLEKIAQGQDWKLEVLDTPQGREFRGIIGSDDDDEDQKEGKDESREGRSEAREKDQKNDKDEDTREGSEEFYKEEL